MSTRHRRAIAVAALAGLGFIAGPATGQGLAPIVYTVRIPAPATHYAYVEVVVPAAGRRSLDLMMATWSPGFYRVEDYAGRVEDLLARASGGAPLSVERTGRNRWKVPTGGAVSVSVSYRLLCDQRSVTTNSVSSELGVLNGAATFLTLAEPGPRAHEVRLELPAEWKMAMTALARTPDGLPNHYRAADFDTLVDSPIVAGALEVHEFEVEGSRHLLVDVGERERWDGRRAAGDLERMVRAVRRLWGFLPFERYVFLNVFRQGGGGLEHKDSTLLTADAARVATPPGYARWLAFAGHEYFHAFNVKRLRPVELGPFDYESAPRTSSLWISEGLTSYYAGILLARAGLTSAQDFLASLSAQIERLQQQPGRLLQTLEQSSLDVWSNSLSGVNPNEKTVSYYVKGQVVGFLLDARIRASTAGAMSLDDVMRAAYRRYAADRGFTADEFRAVAEGVAGVDLKAWFKKAIASTEELDYSEALDWFGLRFAAVDGEDAKSSWNLAIRDGASDSQKARLRALLEPSAERR